MNYGSEDAEGADSLVVTMAATSLDASPLQAAHVRFCLGLEICFEVSAEDFVLKGNRWAFKESDGGVRRLVVDMQRQLVMLRVTGVELGDVPKGASMSWIRLDVGGEARRIGTVVRGVGSKAFF